MIMKRIDSDDDQLTVPGTQPAGAHREITDTNHVPGLLYRGVPQDRRRLAFRIDSVGTMGTPVTGPSWLTARKAHSDAGLAEFYFG